MQDNLWIWPVALHQYYEVSTLTQPYIDRSNATNLKAELDILKLTLFNQQYIWDKVFKNGPSKICGRQPLKSFLKAVFHKFYLVQSWILCPTWDWSRNTLHKNTHTKYTYICTYAHKSIHADTHTISTKSGAIHQPYL